MDIRGDKPGDGCAVVWVMILCLKARTHSTVLMYWSFMVANLIRPFVDVSTMWNNFPFLSVAWTHSFHHLVDCLRGSCTHGLSKCIDLYLK